ncbi:MAG: hypothetical protein Q7R60_02980 [bacterium]|nr:hypothetical protein [bacterium]
MKRWDVLAQFSVTSNQSPVICGSVFINWSLVIDNSLKIENCELKIVPTLGGTP